jgi:two-component system, OmpR family, phosphate regulon sensor histidine kinase PhoR
MKKTHIRILVVVMSVALLGLLAFQWFWVQNAVALREKQFRFRVKQAMEAVVERMQDREVSIAIASGQYLGLKYFSIPPWDPRCCAPIETDAPKSAHETVAAKSGHETVAPKNSHETYLKLTPDSMPTHFVQEEVSTGKMVNGKWVSQKTVQTTVSQGDTQVVVKHGVGDEASQQYVKTIVGRMLCGALPIHQRVDPNLMDTMLRQELNRREIDEPFVTNITSEGIMPNFYMEDQFQDESLGKIDYQQEYFRVQLFPHDIRPSETFLELQFPDRTSTTMRAMHVVLPTSGILVVIVMGCFGIALVAFRRQQKLSDLKTDFINNMTHELKTPISTISLALEALGDPDMQTKERINVYTRVIGQENERLKTQVDRVLQAAALERGELKLEMHPLDMDQLVRDQIERIRLHVEGRGGQIHYEPMATDTSMMGDEVHLGGVVFNLLDNANKYSPEKPEIKVATRDVPGGIEIAIQDKGLGISAEAQRRVFEKFYRVPTGNVHDVKGFGIGLSYAKSMARAHGGDIRLDSTPGLGSTFTLFLPQKSFSV